MRETDRQTLSITGASTYIFVVVSREGVPTQLEGCQVVNQAQSWFFLECDSIREDVDKSKEFYLLEVFNADTQELFVNVTSDEPVFQVGCITERDATFE